MITPDEFFNLFPNENKEKIVKFATVPGNYSTGRPSLVLDGSDVPSIKKYPYLSSYTPKPNDRVMLVGNVIIGKIV